MHGQRWGQGFEAAAPVATGMHEEAGSWEGNRWGGINECYKEWSGINVDRSRKHGMALQLYPARR